MNKTSSLQVLRHGLCAGQDPCELPGSWNSGDPWKLQQHEADQCELGPGQKDVCRQHSSQETGRTHLKTTQLFLYDMNGGEMKQAAPDEMATAACFLASDDASFVTGEVLVCD